MAALVVCVPVVFGLKAGAGGVCVELEEMCIGLDSSMLDLLGEMNERFLNKSSLSSMHEFSP